MSRCLQELCAYWGGDGCACTCAAFDMEPPQGIDIMIMMGIADPDDESQWRDGDEE